MPRDRDHPLPPTNGAAVQDLPVLLILSARAEEVATAVRSSGWDVRAANASLEPADLRRANAFLIDARDGFDPHALTNLPRDLPCVALVDSEGDRVAAGLLDLGVTHFLPWPEGRMLLGAMLQASVAVRARLTEAEARMAGAVRGGRNEGGGNPEKETDTLTGLASRGAARAWLDLQLGGTNDGAGGGISACMLFGISQFANINTAYGEGAGDAVLARVAARIERNARRMLGGQALVARMGGTEYLLACPVAAQGRMDMSARDIARHILSDISRPFIADDKIIRLTARCGMTSAAAGDDAGRLLRRVSAALADARRSGTMDIVERGGVRRRGRSQADDIEQLDADLRLALDAGEIGIVYQPQYDSGSDRIVGVEALARWNHPRLGQLDARTLFDAADRSDYLLPLSLHIQRTALMEAGRWPGSLDGLRLAINVTAADIAQEDFVPHLFAMIADSGFPRDRITVEITESGLIENIERAGALLRDLRGEGLRVAIDDFGTGYSSLAYLKALHPDYLKIDHSLSRDILGTPRDRIILRAIIAMARSLAMTVIAEGVESEEQLRLLAREGCDIYQGFLRSGAVTSEELAKLVGDSG